MIGAFQQLDQFPRPLLRFAILAALFVSDGLGECPAYFAAIDPFGRKAGER